MDFLSVYLIFQGVIIVLALVFIYYVIKNILIKESRKTVEKKDDIKKAKTIIETDKEVVYYYENGDEDHFKK